MSNMNKENSDGPSSIPPGIQINILTRIENSINFHKKKYENLSILKAKMINDPELEHLFASVKNEF